ncbi:protein of unassigned function [Methylobacterium oryzae CBMB20]|uniref:Protein of unassigned function n=1 Tax=Methylobacterium oryzae CBMB20 TaxID=693986 RepID=A0A089NZD4_9HYPH|nr:protein of unassigned function [Methylobacterium oryzae CBMB20]
MPRRYDLRLHNPGAASKPGCRRKGLARPDRPGRSRSRGLTFQERSLRLREIGSRMQGCPGDELGQSIGFRPHKILSYVLAVYRSASRELHGTILKYIQAFNCFAYPDCPPSVADCSGQSPRLDEDAACRVWRSPAPNDATTRSQPSKTRVRGRWSCPFRGLRSAPPPLSAMRGWSACPKTGNSA